MQALGSATKRAAARGSPGLSNALACLRAKEEESRDRNGT